MSACVYVVLSLVVLGLLHLFYLLFYLMAQELNANACLRQEKRFLHMRSAQCEALRSATDEIRQARPAHHFSALSALAEQEEWEELKRRLAEAQAGIPAAELVLLMVENAYSGERLARDGVLQSTKRRGEAQTCSP